MKRWSVLTVFFIFVIFSGREIRASEPFLSVGLGAGGNTTTGDQQNYTGGPAFDLSGGWEFGMLQLKGELAYYFYTHSAQYDPTPTRDADSGFLFAGELGFRPFHFLVLTAGYGAAAVADEQTYSLAGVQYKDTRTISGGAAVAGVDIFPISSGRMDIGLQGRYFTFTSTNYNDDLKANPGSEVISTVQSNTKNAGWFILGVIQARLQ
jgi:hypothetical protein